MRMEIYLRINKVKRLFFHYFRTLDSKERSVLDAEMIGEHIIYILAILFAFILLGHGAPAPNISEVENGM